MADSSQQCSPVPPSVYHHTGVASPVANDGVSAGLEHPLDNASRSSLPLDPSCYSALTPSQLHVQVDGMLTTVQVINLHGAS